LLTLAAAAAAAAAAGAGAGVAAAAPYPGAGVAALLGVGVFGMGPGYLSEEERVGYNTLPGDMRDAGLAGELSPTAAAPAGTF
jgi:hypothetical protein